MMRAVATGRKTAPRLEIGAGEPTRDEIAARAYELFLERGGEHGHDMEDWLAAESEVRVRLGRARPAAQRPTVSTRYAAALAG